MIEYSIEELLPHASPMILISDVEKIDLTDGKLTAKVIIKPTDIMYQENLNGVPSYAALEYMAQAIGCFVGYHDLKQNKKPGVGFVLGSRKLSVYEPVFLNNEVYFLDISMVFCDESLASFDCVMYKDKKTMAEATINAYRPNDIKEFMEHNI